MEWIQQNALLIVAALAGSVWAARRLGPWLYAKLTSVDLTPGGATPDDVVDAYALLEESVECPKAKAALRNEVWPAVADVVCGKVEATVEDVD